MKQVIGLVLALVLGLGLVIGMPAVAAPGTTYYVCAETGHDNNNGSDPENAFATIQHAIGEASGGDTIEVLGGIYEEDLVIPDGKDGLEIKGAGRDVTTIRGVLTEPWDKWPLATPNIEILSNGVRIHGFTMESPFVPPGHYSSGIVLTGTDVEIFDNVFAFVGDDNSGSVGVQTYSDDALPGSNIGGLRIYDNTFDGTVDIYQGIFINRDNGGGIVTIENNEFSGNVMRAVVTGRSNTVISGNEMTSAIPGYGITVRDRDGLDQESIEIKGNTVEGLLVGMVIGHDKQELTDIRIAGNTIRDNGTGVRVAASAGVVTVDLNNIVDNTDWGVLNTGTATLKARYNWWGHETGPDHEGLNLGGQGNAVSDGIHIGPWLYRPHEQFVSGAPCYAGSIALTNEATEVEVGSYAGGWNGFSTPIALDSSANTVSKLLDLTTGSGLFIERAQRFDIAEQAWVPMIMGNQLVGPDYTIRPGEGFFIQVRSAGSIPILVRTDATVPPSRNLVADWNLVGLSSLQAETVTTALSGVDYSFVLSPKPPNAEHWSVPPYAADDTFLEVGEVYWVAMSEPGSLFGITTTPVADDMIWDLNQLDE